MNFNNFKMLGATKMEVLKTENITPERERVKKYKSMKKNAFMNMID